MTEQGSQDTHPERTGLLALIGDTPLVPIQRLNPNPRVQIFAKVERGNPGGSIKDRTALWMIEQGERSGLLTQDKTILEATSGNTGIGIAMVAAVKGYRVLLAMSEGVSIERRKILSAYGAQLKLTPADMGTDGAIEEVYGMVADEPDRFFLTDQYNNEANILAHYHGTAREIWDQTNGNITHFIAAMGTTGTVVGCSRRFRELNPRVRIIGVEPYLGHKIQGLKNLKEAYVPGIYDASALDEKINIEDDAAYEMTRRLAREEGLLVGMSSGAAMHVAIETAKQLDSGVIVVLLPDGGERYLSTTVFQIAEQPEAIPLKLKFFNSLSRRYEPFEPLDDTGKVRMYSCGPTVHTRPHVGILRRMLVDDLVQRTLRFAGYDVQHVVSITDVDDNTVQESERTGRPMPELCREHEQEFFDDLRNLGVSGEAKYVRASESVDAMISMTEDLLKAGYAYEKLRSVYFNIGRVKGYGELSGKDIGKIRIGATVDLDRYDKDDPRDFTLFRRSTLGEIRKGVSYKTSWGNVRPSWHVQCSAMARSTLGEQFDIHMASVELLFPHNENELAQSRALTGHTQARTWLHSELVLSGGKKVTYDEENRVTLGDLLDQGYSAREIRFFLLRTHYRQPIHVKSERLEDARSSLRRIDEFVNNLRHLQPGNTHVEDVKAWTVAMHEQVRLALFDDMNLPAAIAAVFRLVRQVNYVMGRGDLCSTCAEIVLNALEKVDEVLGILPPASQETLPTEVEQIVEQREQARKTGSFAEADRLRDKLAELGYAVEDRADGPRVRTKR